MTEKKKLNIKNRYFIYLLPQLQLAAALWLFVLTASYIWSTPHPPIHHSVLSASTQTVDLPPFPTQVVLSSLNITATSYTTLDLNSGQFLLHSNADSLHAPASTTKLLLAWVVRRRCALDQSIPVQESFNQGAVLGLKVNQHFQVRDLLYALLLPSNNDVAVALADGCLGSQSTAVSAMNSQAASWGLTDTHFANPHGLDDPSNYSTAHDLALLAKYAMTDPVLSQIVSTASFSFTSPDGQTYHLKSTNQLLGQDGVTGIKTGSTDMAGENFIARATISGHQVITVVLGSRDRFADTHKLLLEILKVYRWYETASASPNSKLHEN